MRRCPLTGRLPSTTSTLWHYGFPFKYIYQGDRGARLYSNSSVIYKNSLRKTLAAHRSSNRASIIRKVFDRTPTKRPSQLLGSKESTVALESLESSFPRNPSQPTLPKPSKPIRKISHAKEKRGTVSDSQRILQNQIQWNVDQNRGRPIQSPWMHHMDSSHEWLDPYTQLDAELRGLEQYLSPTVIERNRIVQVVSDVSMLLGNIAPHPPQVTGSWRTGFAMGHSDLDFILPVPDSARSAEKIRKPSPTRPQVMGLHRNFMYSVKDTLRQSPLFQDRVDLFGKRSSVLTAIHAETGLRVHFYCGEGLPSSIEYIQDYRAEYPALRPLYMVIRLLLETRDLFGNHKASIAPDTLVMLLVAFLKINHGRFLRSKNLGEQLLAVLEFYGSGVDISKTGVSVDPPGLFDAHTLKSVIKKYNSKDLPAYLRGQRALISLKRTATANGNIPAALRLCLQDPANYMNDLGRTCSRTQELQSAFLHARQSIIKSIDVWRRPDQGNVACSLLASGVHANFEEFNEVCIRSR